MAAPQWARVKVGAIWLAGQNALDAVRLREVMSNPGIGETGWFPLVPLVSIPSIGIEFQVSISNLVFDIDLELSKLLSLVSVLPQAGIKY